LPSTKAGRKVHTSSVYRWAVKHRLQILRRGLHRFVHWPSLVKALFSQEAPPPAGLVQPRAHSGYHLAVEHLKRAGVIHDGSGGKKSV
jgi:hypothetical protein